MTWQPNRLEQERLEKAERLRDEFQTPLYPPRVERTHTTAQAIAAYEALEQTDPEAAQQLTATVCGRIRRVNLKGKVSFMHIEDETGRLQLFLRVNDLPETDYAIIREKLADTDDFVECSGTMMRTQTGEISLRAARFRLLSKSLSPLPVIKQQTLEDGSVVEYGEFTDVETRYRQRYADLAVNAQVREVFRKRARTFSAIRRFLDGEGFLEVETPILQPLYGGAAARPFTTHHNDLDQELYLRISFELYLKRLLVGGYDAVYEIGRDFRNEGVSYKHNPEFTQIEFYKAYIDYNGVMDITERMVAYAAETVTGSTTIHYQGETLNLAAPWPRITMRQAILDATRAAGQPIDYLDYRDAEALAAIARQVDPDYRYTGQTWGKTVEHLFGKFVEPTLRNPTFVIDYPRDISPFAKRIPGDDLHVERFEFYIAGMELGNAFTELNDPLDQEARFLEMRALYQDDDDNATPLDEDYLRAMRYGMPPCGGFGMGMDRLTMLLTDQRSIRDVLLFPHLRDEK